MSFKKDKRQETIIYLVLWTILFIAPIISLAIRAENFNSEFNWNEVFTVWKEYIPFFAVFLIHNHLMAPMLVYRHKRIAYIGLSLTIIIFFQVYQCNHRPNFKRMAQHRQEMIDDGRPPLPPDFEEGPKGRRGPEGRKGPDRRRGPQGRRGTEGQRDTDSTFISEYNPADFQPPHLDERKPMELGRHDMKRPPLIFGQHDLIAMIVLLLMLGMNIALKLYFRQRGDHKRMEELEKQNLEQQLEYLKYQINPHFFMNTLNNIHALVDIDPEKAKATILELSKMMRFVLYEGNKKGVPLDREIAFLQNYITLMKLRYTDKVKINVNTPSALPNKEVPPLMFITFVENAFKHGVSYRQESFIDIEIIITNDSTLKFTCKNSKIPKEEDKHGGVGLTNVRQRLELIYGNNYTLNIQDESNSYTVNLTISL